MTTFEEIRRHCEKKGHLQNFNNVVALCSSYNIVPVYDNKLIGNPTGIGDILFRILCIKYGLVRSVFNINLMFFTDLYYRSDPLNQLEFRLALISELLKYNDISGSNIRFIFSTNTSVYDDFPWRSIDRFSLRIHDTPPRSEQTYIIFHTKCRHTARENYSLLKSQIENFCRSFKSSHKIIIMGEREFPMTEEVIVHGITTVYKQLLALSTLNDVSDMSVENIYSNLNYTQYKNDVDIIRNAVVNINFGVGGQLCTSLLFGQSTIFYSNEHKLNLTHLENNKIYQCLETTSLFNKIREKC